jgi:hypothetical protein
MESQRGLTSLHANELFKKYGPNRIEEKKNDGCAK